MVSKVLSEFREALFFIIAMSALGSASTAWSFTLNSANNTSLAGWNQKTITFDVNPTNCPSNIYDLIDSAVNLWNSVPTSSVTLARGTTTSVTAAQLSSGSITSGNPIIACDSAFSTDTCTTVNGQSSCADPSVIAGLGYTIAPTSGGHVVYGYLLVNAQSGAAAAMANLTNAQAQVVMAHEIGHVLGLGHSSDISALMYFNLSSKTGLALSQDDVDGLTFLYPRSELDFSDTPFGGCGRVMPSQMQPPRQPPPPPPPSMTADGLGRRGNWKVIRARETSNTSVTQLFVLTLLALPLALVFLLRAKYLVRDLATL